MRLNGDELKTAFRFHVAGAANAGREGCPTVDEIGATMLADTDETARLRVVDHLSRCLPCAREFAAARLLHAGHLRVEPMLPDRLEADPASAPRREARIVRAAVRDPWWRTLLRPTFALAGAASLGLVFVAGAIVSQLAVSRGPALVAIAPAGRAVAAELELAWRPAADAASYDVTMSWPTGKVFFESGPVTATRLVVPATAVAKMKRGQTCLWTLRALDASGREIARETFSFVVEFDPPRNDEG